MARKKKTVKQRKTPRKTFLFIPYSWIFQLGFIFSLVFVAYVMWIDRQVTEQFTGKRWELPARVFARALEVFPEKKLSQQHFIDELQLLGYRKVSRLSGTGQYRLTKHSVEVYSRGFEFWDGNESSRRLRLTFSADKISQIIDMANRQTVYLARMDPMEIAKIYPRHNEDRVLLRIDEVPVLFIKALLAVEDRYFYRHIGIDFRGIARAMLANIRAGSIRQGGSTLTQQLVKNFYLTRERTLWRKLNEVLMSLLLEWRYSKNEILEAYLNEIFLGQDGQRAIHGFGQAAWFYFGRPIQELSSAQLCLLAALPRGASYYDPRRHADRAIERRNHVLDLLDKFKVLSSAEVSRAKASKLGVTAKPPSASTAYPAFMDLVRRQLRRDYKDDDLRSEGLQIFTTLDPVAQKVAASAVRSRLAGLEKLKKLKSGLLQSAVVITDSQNGEVLALMGDRNVHYAGFNRALDAFRPIGSLVKPVVYLSAISEPQTYNVLSPLRDEKFIWKNEKGESWVPSNYDSAYHGVVSLKDSLALSYNLSTVKLGMELGINRVATSLRELGVERNIPHYPSLFLGAINLSPLEVAQLYQIFASGGFRIPLRAIRAVTARDGKPLQRYDLEIKKIIEPAPAYLLNYLLAGVVNNGTARSLNRILPDSVPLAGKTGTTNELRDSWFAGYGSDILAVAWIGRDDNGSASLSGGSGALRIWSDIMQELKPSPLALGSPEEIAWVWTDPVSGLATGEHCGEAIRVPYIKPYLPQQSEACQDSGTAAESGSGGQSRSGIMGFFRGIFE